MFTKLFAFLLILAVLYAGSIFLVPEIADTYGHKKWNDTIRKIKSGLDTQDFSAFSSGGSIYSTLSEKVKPLVEESKAVKNQIETTVSTKKAQIEQTRDAVEKAYQALEGAKKNIETLTNFSTGSAK